MKKAFLASRMKHLVVLQKPLQTADGAGGFTTAWEDVATLWAEIAAVAGAPYFGKEYAEGRAVRSLTRYKVTMRYRAGVATDMRLVVDERVLRITAVVEPLGEKTALELIAEEHV
jgi:SPP1 family predicted phage head-tail adaptor